ncbi:MAG: 30S ribosomal protein S8 [Planctomycetota bacterium]
MGMTDPIADMLTRIRNAIAVAKPTVSMDSTKVKLGIAEVLKREGYIADFGFTEGHPQNLLTLTLKYGREGERVIQNIRRESRPGRRVYVQADAVPKVLNGLGIAILSTNQGILSDREARAKAIGGELLCTIW